MGRRHGRGRRRGRAGLVAVVALLGLGCAAEIPAGPPVPSRPLFDSDVYPILVRDCGFPDCHGNRERFFRVHGPGRTRLDPGTGITAAVTPEERDAAFERARSMLSGAARPEETLLVRKPLEVDRGGAPHLGIDERGRDVYGDPADEGYATLLRWARTGFAGGG